MPDDTNANAESTPAEEPTRAAEPPTEAAEPPTQAVDTPTATAAPKRKQHLKNGVPRWKRVLAAVLLVIGFLLVPLSALSIWSRNQLLNTDRYVNTVAPLADYADIQAA